jgi:hypothetical protein
MAQTLFKGGISKVEFAATNSFPGTELKVAMKDCKVEMKTPTEDLANGLVGSAGKQIDLTLPIADVDSTPIATLQGYENALTSIFWKITGINTAQSLIVKNGIPIVEFQMGEAGKLARRVVKTTGYADTEANLLTLTIA